MSERDGLLNCFVKGDDGKVRFVLHPKHQLMLLASVCFLLGFFSFGKIWVEAITFSVMAIAIYSSNLELVKLPDEYVDVRPEDCEESI